MKLTFLIIISIQLIFSQESISSGGTDFTSPILSTWAKYYQKRINVVISFQVLPSSEAVSRIKDKKIDFVTVNNTLSKTDIKNSNLVQFPVVFGGVVPIVNIYGVEAGRLRLANDILAKIYLKEIKKWDDPRIKKHNPTLKLPSANIVFAYQTKNSGTTSIFADYLESSYKRYKKNSISGKTYKNDKDISDFISKTGNSIAYVSYTYAKKNKLIYTEVENKDGNFVEPNTKSFQSAAKSIKWDSKKHFSVSITNSSGKKSWPITGISFVYLNKEQISSNQKVKRFLDWCYTKGGKTALSLSYVPLPSSLKSKIKSYWDAHIK